MTESVIGKILSRQFPKNIRLGTSRDVPGAAFYAFQVGADGSMDKVTVTVHILAESQKRLVNGRKWKIIEYDYCSFRREARIVLRRVLAESRVHVTQLKTVLVGDKIHLFFTDNRPPGQQHGAGARWGDSARRRLAAEIRDRRNLQIGMDMLEAEVSVPSRQTHHDDR